MYIYMKSIACQLWEEIQCISNLVTFRLFFDSCYSAVKYEGPIKPWTTLEVVSYQN